MTPELPETFKFTSILYALNTHPLGQISLRFALRPAIFEIQYCWPSEMHQWSQNDLKHLTVESTLYTLNTHPELKLHSVSFCDLPVSRYKVVKNWKWTEWPQNDLRHLSVNSTPYTLNTHPRDPNFIPFPSTISRFRDTRLLEIGNTRMTPEWP